MNRKQKIGKWIALTVCAGVAVNRLWHMHESKIAKLEESHQTALAAARTLQDTERTRWGEEYLALEQELAQTQTEKENLEKVLTDVMADGTWNMLEGIATAYSPFDNVSGIEADADPEFTSTGVHPGPGIIAVDPAKIPYGSEIVVIYPDGTKYYGTANDTGGALRDNPTPHVDIFRYTYAEALEHGVQDVTILWRKMK